MLIEYLGVNDYSLVQERRNQVTRVVDTCRSHEWPDDVILQYFEKYPAELSFITAIEHQLGLELSSAIPKRPLALDR